MDTLIEWLPRIGAVIAGLIGAVGFFKPTMITDGLGIQMTRPIATSEVRGVLGGANLGGALAALYLGSPEVFIALGMAWVGVTAARFLSIAVDGTTIKDSIPPILIDSTIALLFLSAAL
jgi:hypothetical protein